MHRRLFSDDTAVCEGQDIFFLLQDPQGEVLIITSVSSFSVFIQKPDHTPQRQTEEYAHTHTRYSELH